MTSIPDDTLHAYRSAIYRIDGEPPIDMIIDKKNDAVASLLARHGVTSAVFVTAFNPFGEVLGEHENAVRQRALVAYIGRLGRTALAGAGIDPGGVWGAEVSLFVLGADEFVANELMAVFKQNAVVIVRDDGVPRLRLHRRYR
jgi:hypothetical protein